MPSATTVSIIVPTYREAPNIEPLVRRAFAATRQAGIDAEMIVVDDDSQDGTEQTVGRLAAEYPGTEGDRGTVTYYAFGGSQGEMVSG